MHFSALQIARTIKCYLLWHKFVHLTTSPLVATIGQWLYSALRVQLQIYPCEKVTVSLIDQLSLLFTFVDRLLHG